MERLVGVPEQQHRQPDQRDRVCPEQIADDLIRSRCDRSRGHLIRRHISMTPDRILVLSANRPTWSWANWLTPSAIRGCGEIRDLEPAPGPFGSGRSGAWFA